jgi:hypothetical protein
MPLLWVLSPPHAPLLTVLLTYEQRRRRPMLRQAQKIDPRNPPGMAWIQKEPSKQFRPSQVVDSRCLYASVGVMCPPRCGRRPRGRGHIQGLRGPGGGEGTEQHQASHTSKARERIFPVKAAFGGSPSRAQPFCSFFPLLLLLCAVAASAWDLHAQPPPEPARLTSSLVCIQIRPLFAPADSVASGGRERYRSPRSTYVFGVVSPHCSARPVGLHPHTHTHSHAHTHIYTYTRTHTHPTQR